MQVVGICGTYIIKYERIQTMQTLTDYLQYANSKLVVTVIHHRALFS